MQKSSHQYLSRFLFLPLGSGSLLISIILILNFKTCASELEEFKESIQSADENFIEGTVEANPPFLKTPYSNTSTVLYYQQTEGEITEKSRDGSSKKKTTITNLKSASTPFLLKSGNYYIFYGLFGKDFSIEHDYDFKNPQGITIQYEKHIYNKDYISIYTEEGNLRYPDTVKTPFMFFRGSRKDWILYLDSKIDEWNNKIKYSIFFGIFGLVNLSVGFGLRLYIKIHN